MSKIGFNSKTRALREFAAELGYSVEHTKGGHLKFVHPDGKMPVFSSSTPHGQSGERNCMKQLERNIR